MNYKLIKLIIKINYLNNIWRKSVKIFLNTRLQKTFAGSDHFAIKVYPGMVRSVKGQSASDALKLTRSD